jgi:signal peptidase
MNLPYVQAGKRLQQTRASLPVARAVRVLVSGLFISTILMAALVFGSSSLPALLGYNTMVVTSGSMEPAIRVGDAVLMRPPSPGAIRDGDVITFKPFGSLGLVTHRVVATSEIEGDTYFQTQGDANATPDPDLTSAEAVFGKVALTLPKMGFLLHFAATPRGKMLMIALPLFVLMVREVRGYFSDTGREAAQGHDQI